MQNSFIHEMVGHCSLCKDLDEVLPGNYILETFIKKSKKHAQSSLVTSLSSQCVTEVKNDFVNHCPEGPV